MTVCVMFVEVLPLKLPSPPYAALIVWPPKLNVAVASVACPDALTVTLVGEPPSSVNATVPVRVPAPGATGLTVAVKLTDWPNTDGLAEDASVVVVSASLTVWMRFVEVLPLKFPSPL